MEFPDLGKHCTEKTCKQLDFLPMKCDACDNIFCQEHIVYTSHSCKSAYKKDIQVPVCPLCSKPIPVKRGEAPDIKVGEHIDSDCQSDPAKAKRKVFTNSCSMRHCKTKEMMKVLCDQCKQNYCLKHRHPTDHQCTGPQAAARARDAAVARMGKSQVSKLSSGTKSVFPQQNKNQAKPFPGRNFHQASQSTKTPVTAVQGTLSEDEALARALQASMQETHQGQNKTREEQNHFLTQEEEDHMLAQAIAASQQETRTRQRPPQSNHCLVS